MKIIKKGNKNKEVPCCILTCPECGCIAEFVNADIKGDRDGHYVVCPQCGSFVSIESEYVGNLRP